ncbi:hypothetical protein A4X09_0g1819 [Tilletia walkeri]|uniref:Uncharacterized protein n=1 Tax=Tilletia walkeri TaxID=117179 RepID=A0A8X7T748_9BASI|nr:hypothetical protein A4X09_0g1819 [Tilletia walkeri]
MSYTATVEQGSKMENHSVEKTDRSRSSRRGLGTARWTAIDYVGMTERESRCQDQRKGPRDHRNDQPLRQGKDSATTKRTEASGVGGPGGQMDGIDMKPDQGSGQWVRGQDPPPTRRFRGQDSHASPQPVTTIELGPEDTRTWRNKARSG